MTNKEIQELREEFYEESRYTLYGFIIVFIASILFTLAVGYDLLSQIDALPKKVCRNETSDVAVAEYKIFSEKYVNYSVSISESENSFIECEHEGHLIDCNIYDKEEVCELV